MIESDIDWDNARCDCGSDNKYKHCCGKRKYKNVMAGNNQVALSIDDLESIQPWKPRGIKVNGTAEIVDHSGMFGPGKYLKITPTVSWSWGIKALAQPKEGQFFVKTVHGQY